MFSSGVQIRASDEISIAIHVVNTCISSQHPSCVATVACNASVLMISSCFWTDSVGHFLVPFSRICSVFRAVASRHAPSTVKPKGSSGYKTNTTLNPPRYSILRPSWVISHQLTRFGGVYVSSTFRRIQLHRPITSPTRTKLSAPVARGSITRDNTRDTYLWDLCPLAHNLPRGSGFNTHP